MDWLVPAISAVALALWAGIAWRTRGDHAGPLTLLLALVAVALLVQSLAAYPAVIEMEWARVTAGVLRIVLVGVGAWVVWTHRGRA